MSDVREYDADAAANTTRLGLNNTYTPLVATPAQQAAAIAEGAQTSFAERDGLGISGLRDSNIQDTDFITGGNAGGLTHYPNGMPFTQLDTGTINGWLENYTYGGGIGMGGGALPAFAGMPDGLGGGTGYAGGYSGDILSGNASFGGAGYSTGGMYNFTTIDVGGNTYTDQLGGGSTGNYWSSGDAPIYGSGYVEPIILDLDGNGVRIETLETSRTYFDMAGSGGRNRTAWAGANDGVLAIDANGDGLINQRSEVVFTDWTGIAGNDMQALKMVFDNNNDGKLTSADARWNDFKVVQNGAVLTLAQLNIDQISLNGDTVTADMPDGSQIQTSSTFRINGITVSHSAVRLAFDQANGREVTIGSTQTAFEAGNGVRDSSTTTTANTATRSVNHVTTDFTAIGEQTVNSGGKLCQIAA